METRDEEEEEQEEASSSSSASSLPSISIPRGGPIYVDNLVGPLITVPEFEAALLHELHNLKAEFSLDSSHPCHDHDLSVDELKIFSEEELVNMALKEAFKDDKSNEGSLQPCEDQLNVVRGDASTPLKSSDRCNSGAGRAETMSRKNTMKRKKMKGNDCADDDSYLAKVEEIAKIKQKQDQDKAAAKLHVFDCKIKKSAVASSERIERMQSLRSSNCGKQVKSEDIHEHIAVQLPEVVLCIEVFHNMRKWVKSQEFLVLGRQVLTEMRDKIHCLTEQVMQKAGRHDPSGYFLIENVFYNDLRDPSAIDYSEPIFDWLENSRNDVLKKWEFIISGELQRKQKAVVGKVTAPNLPQFERAHMHKHRFCDLKFRLGAGYLYCHQGDCKHKIVIRDMRMIHPDDVQNRAAYPLVIFHRKFRARKCNICNIFRATKVTMDDKWAPENPCYFCNDCYYLLHHSHDGSLLYSDFSAYDYLHD